MSEQTHTGGESTDLADDDFTGHRQDKPASPFLLPPLLPSLARLLTLIPPSPMTTILAALRTVERRCAMTMTVRPTWRESVSECVCRTPYLCVFVVLRICVCLSYSVFVCVCHTCVCVCERERERESEKERESEREREREREKKRAYSPRPPPPPSLLTLFLTIKSHQSSTRTLTFPPSLLPSLP